MKSCLNIAWIAVRELFYERVFLLILFFCASRALRESLAWSNDLC